MDALQVFDFDREIDRSNTGSLKWDVKEGQLPMWVADMDFEVAPAIKEALRNRVEHGVFGYTITPDEWYDAYISWWQRRHHFTMEKDWLIFSTGVVPIISSVVRKITTPAENVIVITPAYNIFFNSIFNNGRNIVECILPYNRENCSYHIDFADLEKKCSDPQSTLLILCNPHNPTGKIWDADTLARIGEICKRHHVTVLSDEIHCDITLPGTEYTPFASVSETCREISITCIAPTKAFNIAGLQTAAVCVPNEELRHKVWRGLNTDEVAEGNVFSYEAAIAAFRQGEPWLKALLEYLAENRTYAEAYIKENISELRTVHGEATYLLWIDCDSLQTDSETLTRRIEEKTGLILCDGCEYRGDGIHFLRMNLACPRSRLQDGLERLKKAVQ